MSTTSTPFSDSDAWDDADPWPGHGWPTLAETFSETHVEDIDGDLSWTAADARWFSSDNGRVYINDSAWVAFDSTNRAICDTSLGDPDQHVWAHVGLGNQTTGGVGIIARWGGSDGY